MDSGGRSFALELIAVYGSPGSSVTAYGDRGGSYVGRLSVNGGPRLGRLALRFDYAVRTDSSYWFLIGFFGLATVAGVRSYLLARGGVPARARLPLMLAFLAGGVGLIGLGYVDNLALFFYVGGLLFAAGVTGFVPLAPTACRWAARRDDCPAVRRLFRR